MPDPIPSDWPEAAEDAALFFVYRAQVGAAFRSDRLSPEDIRAFLVPRPDEPLTARLVAALAGAYRRDCDQAKAELTMAAALGEHRDPPEQVWLRHRAALLARPEASPLRTAVERFTPVRPTWWTRLLRKLRGS